MVLLFKEISESPKTRSHNRMQDQKDPADVTELHSPVGLSKMGELQHLILYQVGGCFSQEKGGQGNFPTANPSREVIPPGSSHSWEAAGSGWGWATETGQLWSVHNNRVWVMCTVWSDLPCLLSCSHPEAIKLWIGRGEFLSNYENVSGKGIFTKAC